jgi:hypothetical protein
MLTVAELLAELPESDHVALVNHLGAGLHDARLAAQCVTDPDPHSENVVQLLAYIGRSISRLEEARAIIRPRA